MCFKGKEMIRTRFYSAYYLAKRERPFTDFPDLLVLDEKMKCPSNGKSYRNDNAAALFTESIAKVSQNELSKDLPNANFYSFLSDGSTDTSITEKELVYVLYLNDGTPTIKYLSIEDAKTADSIGLQAAIEQAFNITGISSLSDKLVGLYVDGASVNMGRYKGLATQFREMVPWLDEFHCFNHRLELAFKDAFEKVPAFQKIHNFLLQLYYMYEKSPKRLQGLKELSVAYEESIPKPAKATGTRWLEHKYSAMKIALENFSACVTHFEDLAHTDSGWEKGAKIKGWLNLWKEANLPVNLSVYLDILVSLRCLSLGLQAEKHDPVQHFRRIQEFAWTMAKLQIVIDNSLDDDDDDECITYYKCFRDSLTLKTVEEGPDETFYQGIKLKNYNHFREVDLITRITQTMADDLKESLVFEHLLTLLDTSP